MATWPPDTIVRVLSIVDKMPPSAAELWFDADGNLQEVLAAREVRCRELAEKTAALLRQKGLTVEVAVRRGRRRKTIAQERGSWQADRVVDTTRACDI